VYLIPLNSSSPPNCLQLDISVPLAAFYILHHLYHSFRGSHGPKKMGRAEAGSSKAIGNAIKAKGEL
jgi:hypothetical protein